MTTLTYTAATIADTDRLGAALAEILPESSVVELDGTLGAGKTRLVQAVAAALGVPPQEIVSPTFVLVNEYEGSRPIAHFDAYRLRDEDEFAQLGPEEYFDRPGLTFIEWGERVAGLLPPERLTIRIAVAGHEQRRFEISGPADPWASALARLQSLLEKRTAQ